MQVLAVVKNRPEVQKISFVAHSLGGLIARYAVGRLYKHASTSEPSGRNYNGSIEEHTNNSLHCIGQLHHAKIAGLEPMNFITFATPHLGSGGHRQVDQETVYFFSKNLSFIANMQTRVKTHWYVLMQTSFHVCFRVFERERVLLCAVIVYLFILYNKLFNFISPPFLGLLLIIFCLF